MRLRRLAKYLELLKDIDIELSSAIQSRYRPTDMESSPMRRQGPTRAHRKKEMT